MAYEPFRAAFTGQLSTFLASDGRRYIFSKPLPKVQKDRAYVMELLEGRVRLIPVVTV